MALGWLRWDQRNEAELIQRDKGSSSYYVMLSFATILATLGILLDNPNVVLGAMLVAPLMTPLSALAVAIAHGRFGAVLKALSHVSMSIAVIVGLSTVLTLLIPTVGVSQEAIARAQPTLLDLFIALTAGAAAMYAYLHKDVPESLVGVAVAVSLVPPLGVVGVGLALGELPLSLGALVLFFANVVAILSGSLAILLLTRRFAQYGEAKEVARTGGGVTLGLTLVLLILLASVFWNTFRAENEKEVVRQTLAHELQLNSEVELENVVVVATGNKYVVEAIVRLPKESAPPDIPYLAEVLTAKLGKNVDLQMSAVRTERLLPVEEVTQPWLPLPTPASVAAELTATPAAATVSSQVIEE